MSGKESELSNLWVQVAGFSLHSWGPAARGEESLVLMLDFFHNDLLNSATHSYYYCYNNAATLHSCYVSNVL